MRSRFADHRAPGIRDTWIFIFPTGSQTCPLAWHSLPCKHDSLAQLLVLFSYEMLPWEERGKQGQMGFAECWGSSAARGCLALAERGSELSNSK